MAVRVMRRMREIFEQSPIAERISHEMFPGDRAQSDDEIIDSALDGGFCGYHAVGSCAMGPDDDDVVDSLRIAPANDFRSEGQELILIVDNGGAIDGGQTGDSVDDALECLRPSPGAGCIGTGEVCPHEVGKR